MLPLIFCASLWLALLDPIVAIESGLGSELAAAHRELAAMEHDLARQNQSVVHPQVYIDVADLVYTGQGSPPDRLRHQPREDGVTIAAGTVPGGSFEPYNGGLITVHEVGHWIGLAHTFEGGCDGEGDFIDDTPASANASYGCQIGRNSCPGKDGLDPIHNIMGYSDE
ncbi:hypothetical protein MY11210_008112 [Beauveria gryllotalpidicola]